jgi:hypothetical protein
MRKVWWKIAIELVPIMPKGTWSADYFHHNHYHYRDSA